MIYCDASLVVSALAEEVLTPLARSFVQRSSTRELVVSPWVATEVASALALKSRRGDILDEERAELLAEWQALRALIRSEILNADDFRRAEALVDAGPRGLRAGDALHLAIAMRAGYSLATLDRGLADAAEAVGVKVALRPPT